jgi:hypothetical protein
MTGANMVDRRADVERRLLVPADSGAFGEAEIDGCDEPVQRYFRAAIAPGTPLARAARIRMRGSIKVVRWLPFRSDELLAPLHGYVWPAIVAGGLLRGSDTYVDGTASMIWKLCGLVPVIRAGGPDLARSAMGRAVAESVWLPTAVLPRYGVGWAAEDDRRIVADIPFGHDHARLHITMHDDGRIRSARLDRWSDPDNTGHFDWHPFGIDVAGSRQFPCGITLPAAGTGGWFHGTDRWTDGAYFRYTISAITLA